MGIDIYVVWIRTVSLRERSMDSPWVTQPPRNKTRIPDKPDSLQGPVLFPVAEPRGLARTRLQWMLWEQLLAPPYQMGKYLEKRWKWEKGWISSDDGVGEKEISNEAQRAPGVPRSALTSCSPFPGSAPWPSGSAEREAQYTLKRNRQTISGCFLEMHPKPISLKRIKCHNLEFTTGEIEIQIKRISKVRRVHEFSCLPSMTVPSCLLFFFFFWWWWGVIIIILEVIVFFFNRSIIDI